MVSAIEKVLIPFEKRLPSTKIKQFLVTPEVVKDPEGQLKQMLHSPSSEMGERFEKAREWEIQNVMNHVRERAKELIKGVGLEINDRRVHLVADLYFREVTDVETAFEQFRDMVDQVKVQAASLSDKMDVKISFDESAVDAIVHQSLESGQDPSLLTYQVAKRLEYGLRLVKDRSGKDHFVINEEAVIDMESYVNALIKKFYRQEYPQG